jgi:hypothetical protein
MISQMFKLLRIIDATRQSTWESSTMRTWGVWVAMELATQVLYVLTFGIGSLHYNVLYD